MDADDLPSCLSSQGSKEEVGEIDCDQGYYFSKDQFEETTVSEVYVYSSLFLHLKTLYVNTLTGTGCFYSYTE